jgi:hypothetical protein
VLNVGLWNIQSETHDLWLVWEVIMLHCGKADSGESVETHPNPACGQAIEPKPLET